MAAGSRGEEVKDIVWVWQKPQKDPSGEVWRVSHWFVSFLAKQDTHIVWALIEKHWAAQTHRLESGSVAKCRIGRLILGSACRTCEFTWVIKMKQDLVSNGDVATCWWVFCFLTTAHGDEWTPLCESGRAGSLHTWRQPSCLGNPIKLRGVFLLFNLSSCEWSSLRWRFRPCALDPLIVNPLKPEARSAMKNS